MYVPIYYRAGTELSLECNWVQSKYTVNNRPTSRSTYRVGGRPLHKVLMPSTRVIFTNVSCKVNWM